jgi:hypothetical protein
MAYYPRNTWGGRTPTGGPLGRVSVVAIHHTASPHAPAGFDPARWRALEAGEVSRGYSSLAYHFGVTHNGDQIEIRGWGQRGAATGGWNDRSIAIVYDGYFHPPYNDVPTDAAIEAMADLITVGVFLGYIDPAFVCQPHSVLTAGTQWASACPGDNLRGRVNGFGSIEAIARYKLEHAGAAPIPPAPQTPGRPRCVNVCANRVLRQGSRGVCVTTLQRMLAARGFNPGAIDGVFGARTKAAVVCFQAAVGITVDGVVGPQTWTALG